MFGLLISLSSTPRTSQTYFVHLERCYRLVFFHGGEREGERERSRRREISRDVFPWKRPWSRALERDHVEEEEAYVNGFAFHGIVRGVEK